MTKDITTLTLFTTSCKDKVSLSSVRTRSGNAAKELTEPLHHVDFCSHPGAGAISTTSLHDTESVRVTSHQRTECLDVDSPFGWFHEYALHGEDSCRGLAQWE